MQEKRAETDRDGSQSGITIKVEVVMLVSDTACGAGSGWASFPREKRDAVLVCTGASGAGGMAISNLAMPPRGLRQTP